MSVTHKRGGGSNPERRGVPRRVAVLVETSTTWGRAVLRGINAYRLENNAWEIFVEARGLEEHLRVPPGWRGDGVIARITNPQMVRELHALNLPVVNVSAIEVPEAHFPVSAQISMPPPASRRNICWSGASGILPILD